MQSPEKIRPKSTRLVAAVLAALGASSGIPLALAELDYAGVVDVFGLGRGHTSGVLDVLAGVGGVLTLGVVATAFAGAALCAAGSTHARPVLVVAAVAGLATALVFWVPAAITIAAAAALADPRARDSALPAL